MEAVDVAGRFSISFLHRRPPCRHSHIAILWIQRNAYGCHSPASSHGDV